MTAGPGLKDKLGRNVFKPLKADHIRIKPGMERDVRLKRALWVCPAGLYAENDRGEVALSIDGCLECGTCRLACGLEVLDWDFPGGGEGIQYRFG